MATDDLRAFIEARLAEDERVAVGADRGPWEVGPTFGARDNRVYVREVDNLLDGVGTCVFAAQVASKTQFRENAIHIARHDPARVLREVAAKRALIAEHNIPAIVWADDPYYAAGHGSAPRRCVGCGFNSVEEVLIEDIENCPVLRTLASVWSDHPDYRTEWSTA